MKRSKFIWTLVVTVMITNVRVAYAANDPPWENFIPILVLLPIALLIMAFSSLSSNDKTKNDQKDLKDDNNDNA